MNSRTVDDMFEAALGQENIHYNDGYSEGYHDGLINGENEGREVGLKTGFEVGFELGFYRGCIDAWNSAILIDSDFFSSRVQKNIKQMDELLQNYPKSDPENKSGTDIVDSLRMKFRAVCATLNVKLEYEGYPRGSDDQKTGF